jgi:hypothetical protein
MQGFTVALSYPVKLLVDLGEGEGPRWKSVDDERCLWEYEFTR